MGSDIYEAIADLGKIFKSLCSKTLERDVLLRLKDEIPVILCRLKNIFPSAFFDIMMHLAVHLPEEAMLRGPVNYGWMYPIERLLCTLKRYVRNMAHPEGSVAEAYIASECLTFCSRYLHDIETRHNQPWRYEVEEHASSCAVFGHGVRLFGACTMTHHDGNEALRTDLHNMAWYVLNNCDEARPYIEYVLTSLLLNFMLSYPL